MSVLFPIEPHAFTSDREAPDTGGTHPTPRPPPVFASVLKYLSSVRQNWVLIPALWLPRSVTESPLIL